MRFLWMRDETTYYNDFDTVEIVSIVRNVGFKRQKGYLFYCSYDTKILNEHYFNEVMIGFNNNKFATLAGNGITIMTCRMVLFEKFDSNKQSAFNAAKDFFEKPIKL